MRQIGDAKAATEIHDRHLRRLVDTEFDDDIAQQTDHAVRGDLEARDVEDLRPDVTVQTDKAQMIGGEHAAHSDHRGPACQRQTELLVFVGGGDELVGVRLDADGDAHQHVLYDSRRGGDLIETFDLRHRVDHHVSDAGLDGRLQLIDRFIVAVQCDSISREIGMQRDGELAAAADIQRQPLLVDPARHLGAQERLRRVAHVLTAAEGCGDLAAA